MFKTATSALLVVSGLLGAVPAGAQAPAAPPPAAPAPYPVLRLGDGHMSCEALLGEAGQLDGEVKATTMEIAHRTLGQMGGRKAALATGLVESMLPSSGGVLDGAIMDARRAAVEKFAQESTGELLAMQGKMARVDHLQKLARDQHCPGAPAEDE